MSQGQSAVTFDKERRIGAAYAVSMKIADSRFGHTGFSFWVFDANCGCGWNEQVGVPGSPVVLWQAARACLPRMPLQPYFCDRDPAAMAKLLRNFSKTADVARTSVLIPGDNDEALEVFAEAIRRREKPQYAVGAVLLDPNGYFYKGKDGAGPPVRALQWFTREFPKIDIIVNLNIRFFRMARTFQWGRSILPPQELLASLGKRHWLVGKSYLAQGRFILGVGRNLEVGDHKAVGLYCWNHPVGREIMAQAESDAQRSLDLAVAS